MACTDDPGPVPDAQIAQRNARLAAVAEARAKAELLVYVMGALLGKFGNTEISETSISQHFGALYPAVMAKKIKATVPALSQAAAARVLQHISTPALIKAKRIPVTDQQSNQRVFNP